MDIAISPDEVLAVIVRDFPREHEIACQRVYIAMQARRIAELERTQAAEAPPAAVAEG